jgi:hypothetical protein
LWRYRTVQMQAGDHAITVADPPSGESRWAINASR